LIDEVMTPDSSRFWDLEEYRPGGPQASFDKQYLRDYLEPLGWNKQPPAPIFGVLCGGARVRFRAEIFVTLKPIVNDPAGLTIRGGLHALGFESVTEGRARKELVLALHEAAAAQARARLDDMARQLLANAVIEDYRIELQPIGEPIGEPIAAGERLAWGPGSGCSRAHGVTGTV